MFQKTKNPKYLIELNVSKTNWILSLKVIFKNTTPVYQKSWQIQWLGQNSIDQLWRCFWMMKNSLYSIFKSAKYVCNRFKKESGMFIFFFSEEFSLLNNSSKLPLTFLKKTEKVISLISLSSNDISKQTRDFHFHKAHGHNIISIRMFKVCDDSISKPSKTISKSSIKKVSFLMNEKSKKCRSSS